MKSHLIQSLIITGLVAMTTWSCSLDLDPISEFSEVIIGDSDTGDSLKYTTKAEMYSQYQAMYQKLKDQQEHWYLDLLLIADAHADNAYAGTTGSEVVPVENNSLEGSNSVLARGWDRYLGDVAQANTVIDNIDKVPDATLTAEERRQWKAEAKIFRAMIWFDMVRIWGNIPVVTKEGTDITAENIEEVYPLYYPKQNTAEETYSQIIKDLTEAIPDAPAKQNTNKTLFSKSVARALLAKAYAEKPLQDYTKVIQYANEVISDGFSLLPSFGDLYVLNSSGDDLKVRNSAESILEAQYFPGGGNWVSWMFGKDLLDPEENFTWAKWVTPSRDLIKAFEDEGDMERLNQSVVYYATTWSNYYPSSKYAFMFKMRSEVNSIIKLRYADILLLKAEALASQGGAANLQEAAGIVNQIRNRAKLGNLTSAQTATAEALLDAILHERRLELAFEGQRWFDLVRLNKVEEVMNNLNSRDEGRLALRRVFDQNSYLLPIPQAAIDLNSNLVQNIGY